jgi:hypothetical protein
MWRPKRKKNYPHFDDHLTDKKIDALVMSPTKVQQNSFFPFILFTKKFNRFGERGSGPRKEREKARRLRYASRKDAYIYERYREILSELYENELAKRGLSDVAIAYRKLKSPHGRGMCSVDFARAAFDEIYSRPSCVAMALDVSSYFESLDHTAIKLKWCELMGVSELPPDHFAVFQAITRYSEVAREEIYKRLGFMDWDARKRRWRYVKKSTEIPTQLCSARDFREKIVRPSGAIWKNNRHYGIPQGSPISDLIANFYLLDFDQQMESRARKLGGYYRRYCDDILFVYTDLCTNWQDVELLIQSEIAKCGSQLEIKGSKTLVHAFSKTGSPKCISLKGDNKRFEYLGFQFDGNEARFRDKTVSSFYRKLTWAIKSEARRIVRKYPGQSLSFIEGKFDVSELMQRFGRKKGFAEIDDVRDWTFWTYVTRSTDLMGPFGPHLYRQIANYKRFVRYHVPLALAHAFANRK